MNYKTIFVVSMLFLTGFFLFYSNQDVNCVEKTEEKIVIGESLAGLIESGSTVRILYGYYDCHEIEREDIIIHNHPGNPNPIIKIAKGLPGDTIHLGKSNNASGWNILINNEIIKNSYGQPYVLDETRHKMISLYEKDYKGIIPENAYLILGNVAGGSLDSSRFGLVDRRDVLGKAELLREVLS